MHNYASACIIMQIVSDLLKIKEQAEHDKKFGICKTIQNLCLTVLFHHWRSKFDGFDAVEELNIELELLDNKIEGRLTSTFDSDGSMKMLGYGFAREEAIGKKADVEKSIKKGLEKSRKRLEKYLTQIGKQAILGTNSAHPISFATESKIKEFGAEEQSFSEFKTDKKLFVCNNCCKFVIKQNFSDPCYCGI